MHKYLQAISVAFEFTAPYGTYGTRTRAMCHVSFCCTACFCYIVSLLYLVMMANLDSESDDQWVGVGITMVKTETTIMGLTSTATKMATILNDLTGLCRLHFPLIILFVSLLVPYILPAVFILDLKPSLTPARARMRLR